MLPCGMLFSGGIENHPRGRGIKIAVRKSVRIGFCELAIRKRPKHGNLPDNLCRCRTCTRQPACDCTAPPVVAGAAAAGEGRHAAAPGSTACWSGFRGGLAVWSYAGACGLTRECRLFFCVRFLSLPWGGLMHAPVLCAGAGSGGAYARHAAPAAASRSSWAAFPLFRPSPCPGHVFLSFLLRNIFRGPILCRFSGGLPTCFFM